MSNLKKGVYSSESSMKKIVKVLCFQQAAQDWARKEVQKMELNPKQFRTNAKF